jgi:HEAT repeat protein
MTDAPESSRTPACPRRRRTFRLQTLMAVVALIALGFAGWEAYLRKLAVDKLLSFVPLGVPIRIDDRTSQDRSLAVQRGTYLKAIREVQRRHGEHAAAVALARALDEAREAGDEQSARGALDSLPWLGPESRAAVPALVRTIERAPSWHNRSFAASVLGRVGADDPATIPALRRALLAPVRNGEPPGGLAATAALQLGRLGPKAAPAVPGLIQLLDQPDHGADALAMFALGRIGPDARAAVPELVRFLDRPDRGVHSHASGALGLIGPDARAAVPALTARLDHPDPRTRESALRALWRIAPDDPEVIAAMEPLVEDTDPSVGKLALHIVTVHRNRLQVERNNEAVRQRYAEARARGEVR